MKVGKVFDYISGVDPEDTVLTFKLIDDAGGTFKLIGGSGIQLAKPVDFEKSPTKTITFEISDGKFTVVKTFTINIADVNEAPTSLKLSNSKVAETATVDTEIGTFLAVDPEGDEVEYSLTDSAGGMFWIVDNKLYVNDTLNYETKQSYSITVMIADATGTLTKTFTIDVTDVIETITGNSSSQTLKGGIGADKIVAAGGNDTLFGYDSNDLLYGGTGNDTLYGGSGTDRLNGGTGADKLDGGAGTDSADYSGASAGLTVHLAKTSVNTGDAKGDVYISVEGVTGSGFADKLYGNTAANLLTSGSGNDVISGDAGNDTLYGGLGADSLTGGAGADVFVFKSPGETTTAAGGRDSIFDFSTAGGDRINLSTIDANAAVSGNQAFTFLGTAVFTGKAGELRYSRQASDTYIYGDINGDKKMDFTIHLDDALSLSKSHFLL
ncbi:alkaline phosphatase (plasmid) [Sinorhizobium americanum]|uniref:Alkaline phosphatase n=2 Tax=Sinorhizobium americanum TaxID=194963 RepID=A0A1L3LZ51_9HYPH|nr:alkaline phosphatase [Sinorhizobium americanum]